MLSVISEELRYSGYFGLLPRARRRDDDDAAGHPFARRVERRGNHAAITLNSLQRRSSPSRDHRTTAEDLSEEFVARNSDARQIH